MSVAIDNPGGGATAAGSIGPSRRRFAILGVALAVLYVGSVTGQWWPTPDSALYQGLGKSIAAGKGYVFNGSPCTSVTPGFPAMLAALHLAFGEGYWAGNLLSALCGLGALAAAYVTIRRMADAPVALLAVLATALNDKYFEYSHLILTDAPFTLLFWVLMYGCVRLLEGSWRWLALAVASTAAAIAIRAPGLLLIVPLAAALPMGNRRSADRGKALVGAVGVGAAAAATALAFYFLARCIAEKAPLYVSADMLLATPLARLENVALGLEALPVVLSRVFTSQPVLPVGIVLCLLVAWGAARLWRARLRIAPAVFVLYVLAGPALVNYGVIRERYFMPLHPLLAWMLLEGCIGCAKAVASLRGRVLSPRRAHVLCWAVVGVLVASNLPRLCRRAVYYTGAAYAGRYHQVIDHGKFAELTSTARRLRAEFDPNELLVVRSDRVSMLHLLSGCRTESFLRLDRHRDPETVADADLIYADLCRREGIWGVVHDTGSMPAPFANRLAQLLEAHSAVRLVQSGKICGIHRFRAAPPASALATPTPP